MNDNFRELVEKLTWETLNKKEGTPGRQSIATTRGQKVEVAAMEMLKSHPNVASIEGQVFDENIDEFSNIDIVVNTKDGRRVFIPCARDLWLGTSQQDRLQIVWAKFKSGIFNRYEVRYLCLDDVNDILHKKFTRRARRGVTIQKVCTTLYNDGVIVNFSDLWLALNPN